MSNILVYIRNTKGALDESIFTIVSYAKELATNLGKKLIALSVGNQNINTLKELNEYGADKIITINEEKLSHFVHLAYATVIADIAKKEDCDLVILNDSFIEKGLAPRIAIKLNAAMIDSIVEQPKIQDNKLIFKKKILSGNAFAYCSSNTKQTVLTINPNTTKPVKIKTDAVPMIYDTPKIEDSKTILKGIIKSIEKPLVDSRIVIGAGLGLQSPKNWHLIESLAKILNAGVACSRDVADLGWRPNEEHVGQTGLIITPDLYIAIGISGDDYHLGGINRSKKILAINNDPNANIFKIADYGIIGDALDVIPKLIQILSEEKTNTAQ